MAVVYWGEVCVCVNFKSFLQVLILISFSIGLSSVLIMRKVDYDIFGLSSEDIESVIVECYYSNIC